METSKYEPKKKKKSNLQKSFLRYSIYCFVVVVVVFSNVTRELILFWDKAIFFFFSLKFKSADQLIKDRLFDLLAHDLILRSRKRLHLSIPFIVI